MITTSKRFVERMGGKVDRTAGIIRGVKLLGRKSRNSRTYTDRAMREAAPKYNGKHVFLDHPDRDHLGEDRKFSHWVGVVENAQFRNGSIYGDIRCRKQSEHFEELMEAAESFDGFFGMSHVADGESHIDRSGEEIIEAIREVFSVDIVTSPATAAGLFEGHSGLPSPDDAQRNRLQSELSEILRDAVSALSDALTILASRKPTVGTRAAPDAQELDEDEEESMRDIDEPGNFVRRYGSESLRLPTPPSYVD